MTSASAAAATSLTSRTVRRTAASSAPRASSQAVAADAIALTPPGTTAVLPTVATHPWAAPPPARPAPRWPGRSWRRDGRPGGWCRHGWPRRGSRAATGRAARCRCRGRRAGRDRPVPGPARRAARRRRRPDAASPGPGRSSGSRPAARSASAREMLSPSRRPRARSAASAPVITRDPAQATPNRAPSSSVKFTIPRGRRRSGAGGPQAVEGQEGADHTERTVVRAAVGNAVQVGAGDHTRSRVRVTPPGPLVPHPVGGEVQSPPGRLTGEPLTEDVVLGGEGVATVAPGPRVASDVGQLGPLPVEPAADVLGRVGDDRHGGHAPSGCGGGPLMSCGD